MNYLNKAKTIWVEEVPKSGQSFTIQGELIRSIEKLRDESQRNGNINRDDGHQIMLNYIEATLLGEEKLTNLDKIVEILQMLRNDEQIILDDEPYDFLTEKVIEWHTIHPGKNARDINSELKR